MVFQSAPEAVRYSSTGGGANRSCRVARSHRYAGAPLARTCARIFPGLIVPAIDNVHRALVRLERRVAVLQTIEAIRVFAAQHEGQLPTLLSDITDLPVPPDPMTGQPFQYTLSAGKALLVAPTPAGMSTNPQTTLRYELTIAPTK